MSLIAGLRALERKHYQEAVELLSRVETDPSIAEEDLICARIGLIAAYEGIFARERARALRRELEAEHSTTLKLWSLEKVLALLDRMDSVKEGNVLLPPAPDEGLRVNGNATNTAMPLTRLPALEISSQSRALQYLPRSAARESALPPTEALGSEDDEGGLNFPRFFGALRRHAWVIVGMTLACAALGNLKASNDPVIYGAQFELLAEPISTQTRTISRTAQGNSSDREEFVAVAPSVATLKVLKSPGVLEPLVDELQQQYPEISYGSLVRGLTLSPEKNSDIVLVEYLGPSAEHVQDVLARLAETYLEFSLNEQQSDLQKGLSFVEEQIPKLQSRVEVFEESIQQLRGENGFIEPGIEASQLAGRMAGFEQQLLDVRAELNETQLLAQDLDGSIGRQPAERVFSPVLSTARYEALLNQIQEVRIQIAEVSVTYSAASPRIIALQQRQQNLSSLLNVEAQRVRKEISGQLRQLQAREQAILQEIDGLNERNRRLSEATRQYNEFQRKLDIVSGNLNQFLMTQEELNIDLAQTQSPWEILTPPGEARAFDDTTLSIMLGALLGMVLGVGAAVALDLSKDLVNSPGEVTEVADLPLLGVIPFSKALVRVQGQQILNLPTTVLRKSIQRKFSPEGPATLLIESFRSLHANIQHINLGAPTRSLVVSSSAPSEGKTTVAIKLATAAAAMEKRVLLVEADLRSSRSLGSDWFPGSLGLTDLLQRSDLQISDVVRQSSLDANLFILPSGQKPFDPSKLLSSEKMQNLMRELQGWFGLIIYDTVM
ncbi:MAG: polysaccharide biosynthesis tyrosine autokinase, partial [Cyanobacteria bacterium J06641_5]